MCGETHEQLLNLEWHWSLQVILSSERHLGVLLLKEDMITRQLRMRKLGKLLLVL